MSLDIQKTVGGLEDINNQLGFKYTAICEAIKVVEMWEEFVKEYGEHVTMRGPGVGCKDMQIKDFTDEIEEKFFPSMVTAGYKFKIEGTSMEEIRQTVNEMAEIKGVKEVRMHDKDC